MKQTKWKRPNLLIQVLIGALLGVLTGYFFPAFGEQMEIIGSLFLNLIQMVIVPLIFPLVVLAIVEIKDARKFGGVAVKAFLFFFIVTTVLLFIGLVTGYLSGIGSSIQTGSAGIDAIEGIATNINFEEFFLSLIPANIISAMASGDLLPIIFFGILLGFALVSIGDAAEPVVSFFRSWSKAMYKIVDYAISFAPFGVFGVLASDTAGDGLGSLVSLGWFILLLYALYIGAVVLVFPLIALIFGVPYLEMLKQVRGMVLLAFTTGSSSVVLPSLIERLEKFGIPSSIVSFIVPLGYSFNLTGACLYVSLSVMFVANMYQSPIGWGQIFALTFFLTILTKGIAAVPSGALVVLLAAASQLGLPAEGVALLVSVDFFANAGRTAVNVVGNALAPAVVARTEGLHLGQTVVQTEKDNQAQLIKGENR